MSTKTRRVRKELHRNYVEKARESLEAAKESLRARRWNAATINAVHCGISATDALTVFMIGVRHAGDRHEDAITLLQTLSLPRDALTIKGRQLSEIKYGLEAYKALVDEAFWKRGIKARNKNASLILSAARNVLPEDEFRELERHVFEKLES